METENENEIERRRQANRQEEVLEEAGAQDQEREADPQGSYPESYRTVAGAHQGGGGKEQGADVEDRVAENTIEESVARRVVGRSIPAPAYSQRIVETGL